MAITNLEEMKRIVENGEWRNDNAVITNHNGCLNRSCIFDDESLLDICEDSQMRLLSDLRVNSIVAIYRDRKWVSVDTLCIEARKHIAGYDKLVNFGEFRFLDIPVKDSIAIIINDNQGEFPMIGWVNQAGEIVVEHGNYNPCAIVRNGDVELVYNNDENVRKIALAMWDAMVKHKAG